MAPAKLRMVKFRLATDLDQTGNPSPADGLRLQLLVTDLMKAGLAKDQITTVDAMWTGKLLMGCLAAVTATSCKCE